MPALYLQGNALSSTWTTDWPGLSTPVKTFPWWADRISGKLFSGSYDLRPGLGCSSASPVSVDIDIGDPMNFLKISGVSYIPILYVPDGRHIYDGNFITGQITVTQNGSIDGGEFKGMAVSNEGAINDGIFSSGCVVDVIGTMAKATIIDSTLNVSVGASIGSHIGHGVKIAGSFTGNNYGTIKYLVDIGATAGSVINNDGVIEYALCPWPNVFVNNRYPINGTASIEDGYYNGTVRNAQHIYGGVFKSGIDNHSPGIIYDCLANSGVCNGGVIFGGVFVGPWTLSYPNTAIVNGYFRNTVTTKAGGSLAGGVFSKIIDAGASNNIYIANVFADYILLSGKTSLTTSCVRLGCGMVSGTINHGNTIFGETAIGCPDSDFGPQPGYVAKETAAQAPNRFFGDIFIYPSGIMSGGHIMGTANRSYPLVNHILTEGEVTNEGVVGTGAQLFGYRYLVTGGLLHLDSVFQPLGPFSAQPGRYYF